MKIAFIGQKGIPAREGGVERYVEELAYRLASLGHEVYVYCRKHYTKFSKKTYKGINLIYLPSLRTKNLDTITHTFLATLDALRRDFDIIHYQSVGPSTLSFIPRIFKPKAKVVCTFHCRDQFHQKWGAFARAYLRFGEYTACKFPHKTICVSKSIQKFCQKKFKAEPEYIPNGVKIQDPEGEDKIRQFGLEKDKYILTCARLVRHKGIHYLIEAFKKLKTANPKFKDYKLAIVGGSVGTDDYVRYLKDLAQDQKDIIFCGFQYGQTLAQLFKNAYIYVHPSEAEGLPITVLEAMAYGKTVLVSNIPENIEAFAGNGYMFINKDVKDLAYKISLLIKNPELVKKTGQKARNYVFGNYNWANIAQATVELYQTALQEAQGISQLKEAVLD